MFRFITKYQELECFPLPPTPHFFLPWKSISCSDFISVSMPEIISYLHRSTSPSETELLLSSQWLFQPSFAYSAQALCFKHTLCISLQYSGQLRNTFFSAVTFTLFSSVFKPGILHPHLSSAQPKPELSWRCTVPFSSTSHCKLPHHSLKRSANPVSLSWS